MVESKQQKPVLASGSVASGNATELRGTPCLHRSFWGRTLLEAIKEPGLIWLCGPRGTGKTTVVSKLGGDALYIDLEAFGVRRKLAALAEFFRAAAAQVVILDEIQSVKEHIGLIEAALQSVGRRVLVVSSSVASPPDHLNAKLVERQTLTPLRIDELPTSAKDVLLRRLHRGGLPAAFLSESFPTQYYGQWLDSYLVRDFLFRFQCAKVHELHSLLLHLFRGSGMDATQTELARVIGASRGGPDKWVVALEDTGVVIEVPRFGRKSNKNAQSRRFYACDTGLVCWANDWGQTGDMDSERLWKHLARAQLQAWQPHARIAYFQEGNKRLDFVMDWRTKVDAYDCRWDCEDYDPSSFDFFRAHYSQGHNFLICPRPGRDIVSADGHRIKVRSLIDFVPVVRERVSASQFRLFGRRAHKQQSETRPSQSSASESSGNASISVEEPVPTATPAATAQNDRSCDPGRVSKSGAKSGQDGVRNSGRARILVREDDWKQSADEAEDSEVNTQWSKRCRLDLSQLPTLTTEQQIQLVREYRQALAQLGEMIDALPGKALLLEKHFPEITAEKRSLPMKSQGLRPGRMAEALADEDRSSSPPQPNPSAPVNSQGNNPSHQPGERDRLNDIQMLASRALEIRNRLVECNLRLVIKVASKYSEGDLDDLVAEGNLGLIESIDRFDPERGVKPITYLFHWIRGSILKALAQQGFVIEFPPHILALNRKISLLQMSAQAEGRACLEIDELARALHTSVENIEAAQSVHRILSLQGPLVDGDEATLSDELAAPDESRPHDEKEFQQAFRELLAALSPSEGRCLILRFGLPGCVEALNELGAKLRLRRDAASRDALLEDLIFRRKKRIIKVIP